MENSLLTILLRHYYPKTSEKVQELLESNEKLQQLVSGVYSKLELRVQQYADAGERLFALNELVDAWRNKDYKDISYANLSIGVFILLYFISPYDLIPDFIPFIGKIDDNWILQKGLDMLDEEFVKFERWKANQ